MIIFYIVEINILFLLSIVDFDRLRIYFNNLINELIHDRLIIIIFQIDMKNDRYSMIKRYEYVLLL